MLRSLLRLSAAAAFAALLMPGVPSAAPPPGLAYDEIVRIVASGTPPPPGNFQADVAALNAQPVAAATPTPAPRKRGFGGIGGIVGAIAGGGNVAGAVGGAAASNAMDNAVQNSLGAQFGAMGASFANFLQPHLMRYAFWSGWERVEDVTAQTATIRKCDLGQVIQLNLAAKTYTIYAPNAEPIPTAPPGAQGRGRAPAAQPGQPGTALATLTDTTKSLGPLKIEGEPTSGYDTTTSFTTTQATGSCHNSNASIQTVQYLAPLSPPTVNSCPVRVPEGLPETASAAMPTGGCKPTFSMHRSGPAVPTGRLALYSLVSFGMGSGATPAPAPAPRPSAGPSSMGFLTERGNLKTLGPADEGLFGIPQGFTKAP
jgi:hypothetical protein